MSYAFSAKAILEQEELIIKYADMLTVAIDEEGRKGPLNLVEMFNWTTFDILGELGFGEPFGSLQKRKVDERVAVIFDLMKQVCQPQEAQVHHIDLIRIIGMWLWLVFHSPPVFNSTSFHRRSLLEPRSMY